MTQTPKPYNPLDMVHLAESIGGALLGAAPTRMDKLPSFQGAGCYAIYYKGEHELYGPLADANVDLLDGDAGVPLYVGKAVPSGSRKGATPKNPNRTPLWKRLREHAGSLTQVDDLDVEDFYARWLVVEPVWIPLGESILINRFSPVWNKVLDGFGNHAPGGGREKGKLSPWDTVHVGRASKPRGATEPVRWIDKYAPNDRTADEWAAEVVEHLSTLPTGDTEVSEEALEAEMFDEHGD